MPVLSVKRKTNLIFSATDGEVADGPSCLLLSTKVPLQRAKLLLRCTTTLLLLGNRGHIPVIFSKTLLEFFSGGGDPSIQVRKICSSRIHKP